MSLAKSAPSVAPIKLDTTKPDQAISTFLYDGVDVAIYNMFDIDLGKASDVEKSRLKDIFEWSMQDGKSIGDGMMKIKTLENKLGQPPIGMSRVSKLWNWISIQRKIDDMTKRQDALENRRIF